MHSKNSHFLSPPPPPPLPRLSLKKTPYSRDVILNGALAGKFGLFSIKNSRDIKIFVKNK